MKKTGGSYQAFANLQKKPKAAAAPDDDDGSGWSFEALERVLENLTDENIRWVFRHVPELLPSLTRRDFSRIAEEDHDYFQQMTYRLGHRHWRRIELAETLIEQFDAYLAARARTWRQNPHLTSQVLFEAGVSPMYFRLGRERLDACVGELESAKDPVSLFRMEIEPLLQHAQRTLGSIFIEVKEISPALSASLGPHLSVTGWLDAKVCPESWSYDGPRGETFCKAGLDFAENPTADQRRELAAWRQAEIQRRADALLRCTGVETPVAQRDLYGFVHGGFVQPLSHEKARKNPS